MTTEEGAKEISNYLMLGMHHSTSEAQQVIQNILSDIRATIAIEWFHRKNEAEVKLLEAEKTIKEMKEHNLDMAIERDLSDY
jgi:hypothetical protein